MRPSGIIITLCFLHVLCMGHAQTMLLKGRVCDVQGNSVFAVNVYLLKQNTTGTITDFEGRFALKLSRNDFFEKDTLVFSFIGFNLQKLPLNSIDFNNPLNIVLVESAQALNAVVVEARKSISREFSIKEMDRMKIYLNPLASADPLKAIAMLPSSTNTSETANPELRGSAANRTRVLLNGVPISNPVRNSQINGIGFFSLFNPELLKSELIYPSNPPLIYGNTSAGMVDLETDDKLENNKYQLSASLASTGLFVSQRINDRNFVQLYGNLMFSDGLLYVNPSVNKQLKGFHSNDAGINFHSIWSENLSFNFYNYLVSESSEVLLNLFTWQDMAKARTIRDFTVVNLKYQKVNHYVWLNMGTNFSNSRFTFGNMKSIGSQQQLYVSLNYKYSFSSKISLQAGISNEYGNYSYKDDIPLFYYALSPTSPSFHADTMFKNNLPEAYLYFRWKPIQKIIWGFGIRKNLLRLSDKNPGYLSLQTNVRFNFLPDHSLLASAGRYHSLTEPTYNYRGFLLLSAKQFSLEYLFETGKTNISLAGYIKYETGDSTGNKHIKGFEIFLEHYVFRNLKASLSNTFLNADFGTQNGFHTNADNPGYFLVMTWSYFNTKLFNASLSWSNRQGKTFTPVHSSVYNPDVDFYQPLFSAESNLGKYGNYNTFNLSVSKMFALGKSNLIGFISIFNLLNTSNQKSCVYNSDYSVYTFDYYQKKSVYFGLVLSFK
jgi:hypothetical protein